MLTMMHALASSSLSCFYIGLQLSYSIQLLVQSEAEVCRLQMSGLSDGVFISMVPPDMSCKTI